MIIKSPEQNKLLKRKYSEEKDVYVTVAIGKTLNWQAVPVFVTEITEIQDGGRKIVTTNTHSGETARQAS